MPTPVSVAGYSHLAISVTDIEAARTFYTDLFGFEEIRRPDFGFPGMWLKVGDLQLHFVETDEMPTPGKGFPHFALKIPTEDYLGTVRSLAEAGVAVSEPSSRDDWGTTVWQSFLADPAGNIIELTNI